MSNKIKRALVSVTDKTGIVNLCRVLSTDYGIEIVSTGGTAATLLEAGLDITAIEEITGFPEMMDGRVKTLHPKVHGGLLARRSNPAHMAAALQHDIGPIDLVIVNLYAFEQAIAAPGATELDAIENIDIGGPSMLRSAAKNFEFVTVVTSPRSYGNLLTDLAQNDGITTLETRRAFAQQAFALTAAYDSAIATYLAASLTGGGGTFDTLSLEFIKNQDLRYGENPHQTASYYRYPDYADNTLAAATQLQGKELSYNNILDTDAAWGAVREFSQPACVIIKHTNPCGAAIDDNLTRAYQRAWQSDPISAFGGIVAVNRTLTTDTVNAIFDNKQFVEVIIAPDFEPAALELLSAKPNMRVLKTGGVNPPGDTGLAAAGINRFSLRSVEGGVLAQTEDAVVEDPADFKVVSRACPTQQQLDDLIFAWKVCKSVKSNAITLAKDGALTGMGAGQPNRVNSARVAISQADTAFPGVGATDSVAASDAFIPFPDTVEVLASAGVKAIIQPGGSIRDEEVIAAVDAAGMIMVTTGHRHFRH